MFISIKVYSVYLLFRMCKQEISFYHEQINKCIVVSKFHSFVSEKVCINKISELYLNYVGHVCQGFPIDLLQRRICSDYFKR